MQALFKVLNILITYYRSDKIQNSYEIFSSLIEHCRIL